MGKADGFEMRAGLVQITLVGGSDAPSLFLMDEIFQAIRVNRVG